MSVTKGEVVRLLDYIESAGTCATKEDYDEAVRIFYKFAVVKKYLTPRRYEKEMKDHFDDSDKVFFHGEIVRNMDRESLIAALVAMIKKVYNNDPRVALNSPENRRRMWFKS